MIENYKILKSTGVVRQIRIDQTDPVNYVSQYNSYGELADQMSYLRLGYILGRIGHEIEISSITDFGYGNGSFLKITNKAGIKSFGYDITGFALPEGVKMIRDFDEFIRMKHDVVTFYDSLEHCHSISFMKKLKTNIVVISVPWCHYPEDDKWFENWKHRRPNEHIYHFGLSSLSSFMMDCGFYRIGMSTIEDIIRRNYTQKEPNILTAIFKKI